MQLEVLLHEREDEVAADAGGGLHLMAEWYDCVGRVQLLRVEQELRRTCVAATEAAELTVVGDHFHAMPDGGVLGMVLLAESHLAIRTWPASAGVALDIFVCNHRNDNRYKARALYACLRAEFMPDGENLLQVGRSGASG
jgi:S-adenosylmethionine/arginine decarboxylase-like enzyme